MKKILVIGAGQLGSRHLQALNLIQTPLEIAVVDPNTASLEMAKERFNASINKTAHQITFEKAFIPTGEIDVAIVASTANTRLAIIQNILNQSPIKHLVLEKILFTQKEEYSTATSFLSRFDTQVWVNCCMRMMPFYTQLEPLFSNTSITYHVEGSQYGLVTNAIHYLDHVAHLTGSTRFTIDTSYLNPQIISSKRAGYLELTGLLIAKFENGSTALLHCNQEGTSPIQIEIYNQNHRVISKEYEHKAWITSSGNDWVWKEQSAPIPFQSTLTADLINSLLNTNQCKLPTYAESMTIHLQLLEPLKEFVHAQGKQQDVDYPFT